MIKTFIDGYTWYRIYSDYWVEQGGYNTPNKTTITFPVEMANINYSITNSVEENGTIGNYYWRWEHVHNRTTTSVKFIDFNPTGDLGIHWEVKGFGNIAFINNLLKK